MEDLTKVIKDIISTLRSKDIEVVACCEGHVMEPLLRPVQQPFIIFKDSPRALGEFKRILNALGIQDRKFNTYLKSDFDKRSGELRWIFFMPENLLKINTNQDLILFWTKFQTVI